MPDCSVIVPAHDATATLGDTLKALAEQAFDGEVEVVVVDDGSSDGTADLAERAGAVLVRHDTPTGAAGARNDGARRASGEVLAFTDADCMPTPQWLSAGMAAIRSGADLVLGPVCPPPGAEMGPFDRSLFVDESSLMFETANLMVTRQLFERLDGFWAFMAGADGPERLEGDLPRLGDSPFGEDAWFGYRALRAGARTRYVGEALVYHAVFPRGARGYLHERWRRRHFPALLRVVPELRERAFLRYFATRRSASFDLALAGLALAAKGHRRLGAAVLLPYAAMILGGDLSSRRRALVDVFGDAVGLVALMRGGLAARRLLL